MNLIFQSILRIIPIFWSKIQKIANFVYDDLRGLKMLILWPDTKGSRGQKAYLKCTFPKNFPCKVKAFTVVPSLFLKVNRWS